MNMRVLYLTERLAGFERSLCDVHGLTGRNSTRDARLENADVLGEVASER